MDEWPEYALAITQDQDCETWPCSDLDVTFSEGIWTSNGSFMIGGNILPSKTPASDYSTAIVTRAQWQAAVDALKAEKVVEWNGEGLPPVGTVCEMSIGDPSEAEWFVGTVVVHIDLDRPVAVAHNGEDVFHGYAEDFRPIRTTEQIAKQERSKACDKMYGVILDKIPQDRRNNGSDICEALYDAGYRKFEIVDN